jgi:hypothetical protein
MVKAGDCEMFLTRIAFQPVVCSPVIEHLEGRCLLSAGPAGTVAQITAHAHSPHLMNLDRGAAIQPLAHETGASARKVKRIAYSGPIVIKHGGTYTGNWQSMNADVPAVRIRTSQPVTIINSNIRSRGTLIDAFGFAVNLTVRNTNGYGLNPNVVGRHAGKFMDIDGFVNIVAQNNYMQGTAGIYLYNYLGNHTSKQSVQILRNDVKNIDGRYSNGANGYTITPDELNPDYVHWFQANGVHGLAGAQVAWNRVINDPGKSLVEEVISIHDTTGLATSPIKVHDNLIVGAYPADLSDITYTGGGIMLSDNGSAYVWGYNNSIVGTGNEAMAISSGHDNRMFNNRMISSGIMPNGAPHPTQNVGAIIWNYNNETTFTGNLGYNNLIGWMLNGNQNNAFVPDTTSSTWYGNKDYPGVVTRKVEQAEVTRWQHLATVSHVTVGPTR